MRPTRDALEAAFGRTLATIKMAYQPIVSAATRTIFGYEGAHAISQEKELPSPPAVLDAAEKARAASHVLGRRSLRDITAAPSLRPRSPLRSHVLRETCTRATSRTRRSTTLASPLSASRALDHPRDHRGVRRSRAIGEIRAAHRDAPRDGLPHRGRRSGRPDTRGWRLLRTREPRRRPKIDMSLTRRRRRPIPYVDAWVASICTLARDLEMLIVAEGIETEGRARLREGARRRTSFRDI